MMWVKYRLYGSGMSSDDFYEQFPASTTSEYSGKNKPAFRNGGNRQTGIQETALAV